MLSQLWTILALRYALIISGLVAISFFLLPGIRMGTLSADFLPHATCYLQDPRLILLHATSDGLIGLAYLAISANIAYLVYRARQDIPFHWMFMAFGLFIITCGLTHIIAVVTVWHPVYWLSADLKVITAVASVTTAIALPFLIPKVFTMIQAAKLSEERREDLQTANDELRWLYKKVKELDELKSQFFANVSHELRTPLTLILGPAEKLAASPELKPEHRDQVGAIRRSAALLLGHVNNLLEASRLESGRKQLNYKSVDLASLVRLTAAHFSTVGSDRKIDFLIETPDSLNVDADPEMLQRVLMNLLGNSFKFVPDGGRICCRLEVVDGDHEGAYCRITVQDNGPGIPSEMRNLVFERFRQVDGADTRRHGGTGLGLSIAKELAELHGGTVHLAETPGGGATFTVPLPLKAPRGTPVETKAADEAQRQEISELGVSPHSVNRPAPAPVKITGRPRVLIIEDDREMNRFLAGILDADYDVISAHNGREGVEQALALKPDLIMSDIMMPEMTGEQVVARLREEPTLNQTPILLLSARADEQLRIDLLRKGATDYLFKPFSIQEVQAKAANFIALNLARRALQKGLDSREHDIAKLARETIVRKEELEQALRDQREAEDRLRILNTELEERVSERTAELESTNQELESFTSTAAHDLRSPLRTISGMAQVLSEDYSAQLDVEARDYLTRIRDSAKRMDLLIQDLSAYSRVGRIVPTLETLPLNGMFELSLDAFADEIESRRAMIEVEPTSLSVTAQETLLTQVISNLLSNAIKYVAPGILPQVRMKAEARGEHVRIVVEDNGIGINDEDHDKIFELFKRLHRSTEYPGSGLGLAILAKAVGRMGGIFGVESTPGEGSTFWVELKKGA